MIIECKKSSSLLLAVVLLTSLNCLAMEERAAGSDQEGYSCYHPRGIQKPVPSFARSFYTNIRAYGPPAVVAGATGYSWNRFNAGYELALPLTCLGVLGTAALTSHNQCKKRAEQQKRSERGHRLWYAAPAVLVLAGKLVYNLSRNQNYLENITDAAFDAVKIATPFGIAGVTALIVEFSNDAVRAAINKEYKKTKKKWVLG
jgi:hypothetical protein